MAMSIFDTTDSSHLSQDWTDFLKQSSVNNPVTVEKATSGDPSITKVTGLTSASPQFFGLTFNTDENKDRFGASDYNVGGSFLLGLSKKINDPLPTPKLDVILKSFGLTQESGNWAGGSLVDKIISKIIDSALSLNIDINEMRSAMWLTPGLTMRTDTALVFEIDASKPTVLDDLAGFIGSELSINTDTVKTKFGSLATPKIFLQRTCLGTKAVTSDGTTKTTTWHVTSGYHVTFRFSWGNFWFWITYDPTGMTISVTQNMDRNIGNPSLWSSLDDLGVSDISSSSITPVLEGLLDPVRLLNFTATKIFSGGVQWHVYLALRLGRPKPSTATTTAGDTNPIPTGPLEMFLAYDSSSTTFSGGLITSGFYADASKKLLPVYTPGMDIDAPTGTNIPPVWDLRQLSTTLEDLPKALPTTIAEAMISYQKGDPSGILSFSAKLVNPQAFNDPKLVPTPFTWDELDFQLIKGADLSFEASAGFTLHPKNGGSNSATMGISVSYNFTAPEKPADKTWTLAAYVDNLSLGLLWQFFDPDYCDPLLSAIGGLTITSLDLLCTYASGVVTSFCFTGMITMGPVQLRMVYQYASSAAGSKTAANSPEITLPEGGPGAQPAVTSGSNWRFECDLETTGDGATIGDIVIAISAEEGKKLPAFIANITLGNAHGADNRRAIAIDVAKTPTGQVTFVMQVALESVTFTYLQIASKDKSTKTKRLLRFAIDKIPLLNKVPLLGELPQPFDQLEYYWVNDGVGLLQSEVEILNSDPNLTGDSKLMYKASTGPERDDKTGAPSDKPQHDPVVILPGHHFVVTRNKEVIIDHVFNATPKLATTAPPPITADPTPTPEVQPSKPSKGAMSFAVGPLSISAVTLQYKEKGSDKVLSIIMDATFALGPISFSLLGFSIGLPLTDDITLNKLGDIISKIVLNLDGMAVKFDKPPLLIAGGFEHQTIGTDEIFLGGLGISYPPYTFIGVGEYKILQNYKSVFIYAKLDGPIITLEFATIEDVRLGFGYNSMVRSPTTDELTSFPFINDNGAEGAGNDPMNILQSMIAKPPENPWVVAKHDSYWFAAGMTVTAFDVLKITAVAMFAFRDSGLIISLFADAVAQMPPKATDRSEMIVYVEIGMVAEMNFVDGYFRVEAALAPTSFLLVPQCHVYGGFALVYWFSPNEHAGDWVFSIGGYHKNYVKPAWYPEPKRIGISFPIGILHVTGEAYFAITPKVAMGGALIHVTLGFGPIEAWLDASMDALINFHPLHYIADFSVSVGVSFNIDVLFIHIHISASVGAWLHIEGPELGGSAYVDFYLFGFSVEFGATNQAPPAATFLEFWEMLHKPGPEQPALGNETDEKPMLSSVTYNKIDSTGKILTVDKDASPTTPLPKVESPTGAGLKFILEGGNYPMPERVDSTEKSKAPNTGTGAKWFVRGGSFSFRIASDFAMNKAHIDAAADDLEHSPIDIGAPLDDTKPVFTRLIYSRPMRISSPITSTLTVTIREKDKPFTVIAGWQSVAFAIKPVPSALWSPYDAKLDPIFTRNPQKLLSGDGKGVDAPTVPLAMALMVSAPLPELATSFIPIFKPSMVANFRVLDFRTDKKNGTDWHLPGTEAVQKEYLPAAMTAAENDLVKNKKLDDLWSAKQAAWKALDTTDVQGVVSGMGGIIDQVAGIFEWGKNRPQGGAVMSPPLWKLMGKVPMKLVGNMKNCYLELPRMAVVA